MATKVLLIESDADLRSAIRSTLEDANCRCDAVADGAGALLKLRQTDYTYILVDFDSPTSLSALHQQLSAEPALLKRVIVISESSEAPEGMGGRPLLRKPFERAELLERVGA